MLTKFINLKEETVEEIRLFLFSYDELGRRTTVTDAKNRVFTTVYDDNGNILKTIDAKEKTVSETTYNCLNLPHTVKDMSGKTLTYLYTPLGKVDTITDTLGKFKKFGYNDNGQNTSVKDEKDGVSGAVYDALGNITSLSGPLGAATNYAYDNLGRLISESTSSGGTISYEYNELNLKEKMTNARGQQRKYFYDAAGRVIGFVGEEESVSYTYDQNGNVLTVSDSKGTIKREYDALNRVTKCTDVFGKVIRYEYDAVGNLRTLIYPDGTMVRYTYDVNNNLETVTDWMNRTTTYSYDVNNKLTGVIKPDGSVTTTVYDDKQRVVSTVEKTPCDDVITGFEYTYDSFGRIETEKNLAKNIQLCYTYDELSRVTSRTVKDASGNITAQQSYSYDAAGNCYCEDGMCGAVYDINNRLTSTTADYFTYDADGNLTEFSYLCSIKKLRYDSSNRLTYASKNSYTYNAEDTRIRLKDGNGAVTEYTYNTNCKLSQLLQKTTGNTTTKYVYGLGLIGEASNGEFKTYHFDYRGSTVALTNSYGYITDTFEYDTYGLMTNHQGTSNIIFGYNGRDGVITDNNGLLYMRARYYFPQLKRFLNADILHGKISDSTSLNRYAYVNGNPVSYVDPLGLSKDRGEQFDNWFNKIKQLFGWSVDEFKRLTAEGKLDWFLKLTLGAEKDKNDIYHIRQDWWQSLHFVGYNDMYDWAFDVGVGMTGGTVDKIKFPFKTEDGDEYIIWAWKGDYINLGSGAEAGIYEESVIPGHWLTSIDNNLKMSLSLKEIDSGDILFSYTPTQPQWWITGFDPSNQDAKAENLISTVTIDFSNNNELFEGFYRTYGSTSKEKLWEFDGKVATLVW